MRVFIAFLLVALVAVPVVKSLSYDRVVYKALLK